jgi:PAS domain S-box-containing protein
LVSLSVEKKLVLAVGLGVVFFLALCALAFESILGTSERSKLANHTRDVLTQVDVVESAQGSVESGHLGYLLAGEERHLKRFHEATTAHAKEAATLIRLLRDDAGQAQALKRLQDLLEAQGAELATTIQLRREQGSQATLGAANLLAEQSTRSAIRDLLDTIESGQQSLLVQRVAAEHAAFARSAFATGAIALCAAALFAAVYLLIMREIAQRRRTTEVLAQAHAELEARVQQRTAELSFANSALQDALARHQRTEAALKESEERYRGLVELSPDAIFVNRDNKIVLINEAGLRLLGARNREQILGKSPLSFIHSDYHDAVARRISLLLNGAKTVPPMEQKILCWDGATTDVEASAAAVVVDGAAAIQGVFRDITQRKRAEIALRESEARYRRLVEQATDIIFEIDPSGRFVFFNTNAAFQILQYTKEELIGRYYLDLVRPDWRENVRAFFARQINHRISSTYMEFPVLAKDGSEVWIGQNVQLAVEDGEVVRLEAFCRDVTEHRHREEELERSQEKLRELSAGLETAREAERTRIAREIHDELGAILTAIKFDLSSCAKSFPHSDPDFAERWSVITQRVDAAMQTVTTLATELRPSILDQLGLWATLEWQTREFEERMNIACEIEKIAPLPEVEKHLASAIFRIYQEALTNIARHAEATRVDIKWVADIAGVTIGIQDNGKGISEAQILDAKSIGVLGMFERARHLGGEFHISGAPGGGTAVVLRMPLRRLA